MKNTFLIICLIWIIPAYSQNSSISGTINWNGEILTQTTPSGKSYLSWPCEQCIVSDIYPDWPIKSIQVDLPSSGKLSSRFVDAKWEAFTPKVKLNEKTYPKDFGIQNEVSIASKKAVGTISFLPIRKSGNGWEKLISYRLEYNFLPNPLINNRGNWTYTSVLSIGDNYKLSIDKEGIYKLDYNYFKNTLGIDPSSLNPKQIKIFGNGGGMLSEANSINIIDDLSEIAIYFKGEDDGKFDQGDYILIYAEGANKTSYNSSSRRMTVETNLYSNKNYYFLQVSPGNGKRLTLNSSSVQPTYWSSSFQDVIRYEEEKFNLLDLNEYAQGGGRKWYGDSYGPGTEKTYDDKFNFQNMLSTDTVFLTAEFAGRTENPSKFAMNIQNTLVYSGNIELGSLGVEDTYATVGKINYSFLPKQAQLSISAKYNAPSNSSGWLDYIEVMASRQLKLTGNSMIFQDLKTLYYPEEGYIIENIGPDAEVWNITDISNIKKENLTIQGTQAKFTRSADQLERFIVFNSLSSFPAPGFDKKLISQNIHGIDNIDMVILYDKSFESAVQRLKDHRAAYNNLTIEAVRIDQLYNEFSSGRQDITAIRDFARMLYERNSKFKYLLLFGDGSFDYKNNLNNDPHLNFIPVYETKESFDPIFAYPSDDYYALLDVGENGDLKGLLDIAVGRIPVNTPDDAEAVVDKIIHYDNPPETLKDWRNWIVSVADDDDGLFVKETDAQLKSIEKRYPFFNFDKIYLDAFKKVSTPGGDRFPDATTAINNNIYKGTLIINYQGHGGPKGWAQERVLSNPDISAWKNIDKTALFVTATCSFTGYDDPSVETGGELAFLNKSGGAMALLTTVRAVYNSSNAQLVSSLYDTLFTRPNGKIMPIGEALRISKNRFTSSFDVPNARKFTMIGDPSQKLAVPQNKVITYTINGKAVDVNSPDTLKALQKVTITGAIVDNSNNVIKDFNGKLYTTVFDKKKLYSTLGQTTDKIPFYLQKNVLFKGTSSISNGLFTFSFYIPKDIDYAIGNGKISYYAENGTNDANGYYADVKIGGSDTSNTGKDEPPVVKVYVNDENFVSGGLSKNNPTLIAKITDDLGINITGTSIGHDLTAIIDENTKEQIILNDFFESTLNDFKEGKVSYPLSKLSTGKHTLKVKAWDISNNSGEGSTEFIIAEDGNTALQHVLNYPNPFTTSTQFQFEHNLSNNNLHVRISIYSISGTLVKTIHQDIISEGSRISGIVWDGKDDYGNNLAKGVYLYNVILSDKQTNGSVQKAESSFEKLVILK